MTRSGFFEALKFAQLLRAGLAAASLAPKLRQARGPDGWHELTAEDGTVALDLKRVLYVLVDHEDHRVGFGSPR